MKVIAKEASLDDLIFERRNKLYGAYALRKEYPKHLAIGTFGVIAVLMLSIPLPDYLNRNLQMPETGVLQPETEVIEIVLPPLPEDLILPKPTGPVSPASSQTTGTSTIRIVNDSDSGAITDPTPAVGVADPAGQGTGETGIGSTTGTGTEPVIAPIIIEPKIENFAEVVPQYPGGDAALAKQISSLLKYPKDAIADGVEGVVFVSFVVDPNGEISRLKIEKGVDSRLDKEALRVISQLTGWSPAIQNGNPVFFKYVLPVRFVIRKE